MHPSNDIKGIKSRILLNKKIVLGITGSIAAYKAAILVRLLVKEGAEVKVIMTGHSKAFITPLTLATLSKNPILVDFYDPGLDRWINVWRIPGPGKQPLKPFSHVMIPVTDSYAIPSNLGYLILNSLIFIFIVILLRFFGSNTLVRDDFSKSKINDYGKKTAIPSGFL